MKPFKILLAAIFLKGFAHAIQAQDNAFLPKGFEAPKQLENKHLRIRTLTANDVVKDYDAVMTSIDHLQGVFGPKTKWPTKELTFEQDLIDLGWHQKEFQRGSSYAYTVVRLDESGVIGCIYIFPTDMGHDNASAIMWVRSSVLDEGLDGILFETVKKWMKEEWPLKKVAYPGREISWAKWETIAATHWKIEVKKI
jgi:hypothetical protein